MVTCVRSSKAGRLASLFCLLFVSLLYCGSALAQGLGRINGRVTDPSGAAIVDATITSTNAGTGQSNTAITDSNGDYVFPSLPPAHYTVSASAQGFATFTNTNALLQADQALTVNMTMKIGNTSESV